MQLGPRKSWIVTTFGVIAVLTAIGTGVALRLEDPMSTSVIPAEDPYTHMALVREHVRDGVIEPLYDDGGLYPPGMHVFLAAAWAFTGSDLYEIFRFGPVVFGGVGILGMAVLLWRHAGPVASFVGSMAYAVAPETIFRTTMMSPTAMDLALVPFLLMGYLAVATGRLAWIPATAALSAFLAVAHPWLFGILGVTGALFLVYALVFPTGRTTGRTFTPTGFATVVALLAGSLLVTVFTGPGLFRTIEAIPNALGGMSLGVLVAAVVVPLGLLPFLAMRFAPDSSRRFVALLHRGRPSWPWRLGGSAALATLLVLVTMPAVQNGMPELVDLPRMFGWPILALAGGAFIALPFLSRPMPALAAAMATATYPFVIYNPLQSPFWPHRTAVFLGIALAILVGVAAAGLTRLAFNALGTETAHGAMRRTAGRPAMLVAIPALLLAPALGGGVFAATPVSYDGWYRLYQECEMDGLADLAAFGESHPDAVFITGDYQAKLVLAGMTPNADRVWLASPFFTDHDTREGNIGYFLKDDIPAFVVVDVHLRQETPNADTGFLEDDEWVEAGAYCHGMGGKDEPRLTIYVLQDPDVPDRSGVLA